MPGLKSLRIDQGDFATDSDYVTNLQSISEDEVFDEEEIEENTLFTATEKQQLWEAKGYPEEVSVQTELLDALFIKLPSQL